MFMASVSSIVGSPLSIGMLNGRIIWLEKHDLIKTTGWWLGHPSEKYGPSIGMIIPNIWENKKWQPNHQPETIIK